ncbi:MAG: aminotransferase class III-fold pyridoxal phosphate-dependent enzyme [Clostridiaceae bacterium]|nr:aminotransferase class III-fold pyridoxal phosphate-dependent enzyme [Clostridiaceae bacterium]
MSHNIPENMKAYIPEDIAEYIPDSIDELKAYAVNHICPHYMSNPDLDNDPKIYVRSEGNYIYDIEGNKYLDSFASILTTMCGHNNSEIIDKIKAQYDVLDFFPNFGDHYCIPMVALSKKLEKIAPKGLTSFFYVNSGSEANETAIKAAWAYHVENGESGRTKVIHRRGSYHGTTVTVTAACGLPWFNEKYPKNPDMLEAMPADCNHCQCDCSKRYGTCGIQCLKDLEKLILDEDPKTISAMIMDPLPGSNSGYPVAPQEYMEGVRALCDKYGILLIFDEIQCGFAKSGEWFVANNYGITPDILTTSKALTNGYIPLGVCMMKQKIYDRFRTGTSEFRSGSTFGGHNVACRAAIATIDYIEKHDLLAYSRKLSERMHEGLKKLQEKHPILLRVQGMGMMFSLELTAKKGEFVPFERPGTVGAFINRWCYEKEHAIIRNNCYNKCDIVVYCPALTFTEQEIDTLLEALDHAFTAAEAEFHVVAD